VVRVSVCVSGLSTLSGEERQQLQAALQSLGRCGRSRRPPAHTTAGVVVLDAVTAACSHLVTPLVQTNVKVAAARARSRRG
jgi:hypothetical protein